MPDPDSFVGTVYVSRVQFMEWSRDSGTPAEHNAVPGTARNPFQQRQPSMRGRQIGVDWDCQVSPHSSSQRFMLPPPPEQRTGGGFCSNPPSAIHIQLILCGQGRGRATRTPASFSCGRYRSWQRAQHLFPLSPLLSPPCCQRLICDLRDQHFLSL